MDHSLKGYLNRQSDACLLGILAEYQEHPTSELNEEIVSAIQEILKNRGVLAQ